MKGKANEKQRGFAQQLQRTKRMTLSLWIYQSVTDGNILISDHYFLCHPKKHFLLPSLDMQENNLVYQVVCVSQNLFPRNTSSRQFYKKGDLVSNTSKQAVLILAMMTHTGLDFKSSEWSGGQEIHLFIDLEGFCLYVTFVNIPWN